MLRYSFMEPSWQLASLHIPKTGCVCASVCVSEQMQTMTEENQLLQEEHDRLQQRYSKLTADAEQNERIWRERWL